mmetsp:Transcript_93002/g.263189  ORF Transcript_93002/g.263189 Transcript_93002/m.263189 type:complete len:243 (+) Transcript_93002:401-1129(+)
MTLASCSGEKLWAMFFVCARRARKKRWCAYSMLANATTTLDTSWAFIDFTFAARTWARSLNSSVSTTPALLKVHTIVHRSRGASNSGSFSRMTGAKVFVRSSSSAFLTRENAQEICTSSRGEQSSTRCSSMWRTCWKSSPWVKFMFANAHRIEQMSDMSKPSRSSMARSAIRAKRCSSRSPRRDRAAATHTTSTGVANSATFDDIVSMTATCRASASGEACWPWALARQDSTVLRSLIEKPG